MTKTKEELIVLKSEYETLTSKLKELSEEELKVVTGGTEFNFDIKENDELYNYHIYSDNDPLPFDPKTGK